MYTPVVLLTSLLSLITSTSAAKSLNPNLNAMLKMAATNYDRHVILAKDTDWYYDFFNHQDFNDQVGSVITADAATFPALTGLGISYALLKLGPCSMLPPHFHQRAHNLVIAITGNTTSWMVNENGVRPVKVDILPFRATIFPQGSLHTMQNNGCEPALLLSALNSDDSGTLNALNGVWAFPDMMKQAAFGDQNFDSAKMGKGIPDVGTGAVRGSYECRKRCGIEYGK
ncbi:RmlC-like cupin domain-containing protein [Boeremia exigua]|uniref:RmlC-like cupin domain-containing protein n=1 Tax=Boeremia exigua TaxID=749465 RepID=UPI001E8CF848|nr:RmlC-like cupin domain-containing protein [Boeremia exigua]KAH6644045.1 RmlC-like cupin domain-containing protein [Boeremia exigua]